MAFSSALSGRGFKVLKFFPAEASGGIAWLKSIAAPLPDIKFCPTGGIDGKNVAAYLGCPNVLAVGGSWVAPKDAIGAQEARLKYRVVRHVSSGSFVEIGRLVLRFDSGQRPLDDVVLQHQRLHLAQPVRGLVIPAHYFLGPFVALRVVLYDRLHLIGFRLQSVLPDHLGHELPPKELLGLMTFSFDLIIPAGEVPWTETYTRDATWAGAAKPYRFGLRHRFPKPIGLGA
jgi:hypothetical protein